jgi:SAM-dependent methyltransferase
MSESILVELGAEIRRHPWWRARARLTLALLVQAGVRPPARVLDAGCGWGVTLDHLERGGYRAVGLDISRRALQRLDRPGRRLIEADLTQELPDDAPRFDAVLALDVIEHLDDDRAAVERLARLAAPGGLVVVSVPALPELYSEFDAIQGHRRRYRPETLQAAFAGSDLRLESIRWWCGLMVPVLRRQRSRPKGTTGESAAETYRRYLRSPRWPASAALRLAFGVEQAKTLIGWGRAGTSLVAMARRPTARNVPYRTRAAASSVAQARSASLMGPGGGPS